MTLPRSGPCDTPVATDRRSTWSGACRVSISRFSRAALSRGSFAVDLANGRVSLTRAGPERSATSESARIRRFCSARRERRRGSCGRAFAAGRGSGGGAARGAVRPGDGGSALEAVPNRFRGVQREEDPGVLDESIDVSGSRSSIAMPSPRWGRCRIQEIDLDRILSVLRPIWSTQTATATKLQQIIDRTFAFAKVKGYRDGGNAAAWKGNLDVVLPTPSKVNPEQKYPAVRVTEVQRWWEVLKSVTGMGAEALRFQNMAAARRARSGLPRGTNSTCRLDCGPSSRDGPPRRSPRTPQRSGSFSPTRQSGCLSGSRGDPTALTYSGRRGAASSRTRPSERR